MKQNTTINRKIVVISLFFFLCVCFILGKLVKLQIIDHSLLLSKSDRQYKKKITVKRERGIIYDRNYNILAASVKSDSIYAHTNEIKDKVAAAKVLAPLLNIKKQKLFKKLSQKKKFIWLKRKIGPQAAHKIKALDIDGIGFINEFKRIYPLKQLASTVIGFTGIDNKGLAGLEYQYNEYIEGEQEVVQLEKDAKGRSIRLTKKTKNKNKGSSLVTTIDQTLQYIAEKELKKQVTLFNAKGGTAIVMAPDTGEILALANYPSFNPNSFGQYAPHEWVNKAVTYSYEPGSTFKLILAAGAIEEKKVGLKDIFFCENGQIKVGGIVIHDTHKFDWLSLKKIIGKSSNIGAVKVGLLLEKELYYKYIKKFGFGRQTFVDLPGESSGIVRPLSSWTDSSIGAISIGHEISVTPVQLISAFSSIANGGMKIRPKLVKSIEKNKKVIRDFPPSPERIISSDTSKKLIEMLEYVVTDGTGVLAHVDGFRVAGKTGTAQKIDKKTKTYSKDKFIASFVGFLPANNPKIAILVMVDEPEKIIYGGKVAAPAFKHIATQAMRYLRVPGDIVDTPVLASLM